MMGAAPPDAASNAQWYALVDSAAEGFAAYQALRGGGFDVRIAPAPRGVQACCGMSVAFGDPTEVDAARGFAAERGLAITKFVQVVGVRDARRDRFC